MNYFSVNLDNLVANMRLSNVQKFLDKFLVAEKNIDF